MDWTKFVRIDVHEGKSPSIISEAQTILILEQSILPELYGGTRDQSVAQLSSLPSFYSSSSTLQKPCTFPSSSCIDLLRRDRVCLLHGYSYIFYAQKQYFTCSLQYVVDVLAVTSLGTCSATAEA